MGSVPLHFGNCIELALLQGDVGDAAQWLEHSREVFTAVGNGRPRLTFIAYSLLLIKARGERLERSEIGEELVREHDSACARGLYDSAMTALWHYLVDTSRGELADSLLDMYTRHQRRDGYPFIRDFFDLSACKSRT